MQNKTDSLDGTTSQLDLWGAHFTKLEARISGSILSGRRAFEQRLQALRQTKRALKLQLREAAHGDKGLEWEDVRGQLEEAVDDFRSLAVDVRNSARSSSS